MKHKVALLAFVFLTSCRNTWTTETKNNFYRECNTRNIEWAHTPARTQDYCDCMFLTITRKYPIEEEAMKKWDSIQRDPDVVSCREQVKNW